MAHDAGEPILARPLAKALGEVGKTVADQAQEDGGVAIPDQTRDIVNAVKTQLPALLPSRNKPMELHHRQQWCMQRQHWQHIEEAFDSLLGDGYHRDPSEP